MAFVKNNIDYFQGDEKNVLKRMFDASNKFRSTITIWVTGDDVLIDPYYLDKLIDFHLKNNLNIQIIKPYQVEQK